jgi:hypothetical protein
MTMFKKFQDDFGKSLPALIVVGFLVWKHYPVPNPNKGRDEILKRAIQRQIEQGSVNGFSSLIPLSEGTKLPEPRPNVAMPSWAGKFSTKKLLESGDSSTTP